MNNNKPLDAEKLEKDSIKRIKKLIAIIQKFFDKELLGKPLGLTGMVYQKVASYLLAHCLIIVKGNKEHEELLIKETIREALEMSSEITINHEERKH